MKELDIEKLMEHSQVGIQTIAVVLLGWLASSISSLDTEIKDLNSKMVAVVEITGFHDRRIKTLEQENRAGRIKMQEMQLKFYDEFEKLRDKIK